MTRNVYGHAPNAYDEPFQNTFLDSKTYKLFNLQMDDETLDKMLIKELDRDKEHWDKEPWQLTKVDVDNTKYFLGNQTDGDQYVKRPQDKYVDNRLFSSMRAILSYATGQLAVPELTPSKSDDEYVRMAREMQQALYQHSAAERVEQKVRAAVTNLLLRKRGFLKMRFDPNIGLQGDIVTDVVNPEDIVIDRFAKYMQQPNKIYHRIWATVEELCIKFPDKAAEIKNCYQIKKNVYTQQTKMISYWECWFSYFDTKGNPREAVCWFIPEHHLILDKMPNPNWVYMKTVNKEKQTNVMDYPPKPFVWFNYINLGHSFIDDTCLFEQGKPQQDILNQRGQQYNDNISYMNGRWVMSKKAVSDQDAQKFINRGAKTVLLANSEDVGKAVQVLTPAIMPESVYQSIQDTRNEIDGIIGTPSIFKGVNPTSSDTLGRDMMLKQQSGMLQDDLVRAVQFGMEDYYRLKLQMFRVYYTDDYWFQVKGGDGKYDFIFLNGDSIDSNVKIGVQVDSTLPLDKANIRWTAMQLAKLGKIDQLTLMEDLGLPDPDIRTERWIRSQIDMYTYMQSVEQQMSNNEADVDIKMLIAGEIPEERDNYDSDYLQYYNHYITTNAFAKLDQEKKQAIDMYLRIVQLKAQRSAALNETMLNRAGILDRPPIFPLPKRTMNIRLMGNMNPQQTQQIAGTEGQMFTPITGAEQAQNPNAQGAAQYGQNQSPNMGAPNQGNSP
jgi:hypothetical protein